MAPKRYLFTSESVTEGHPDKIADQIYGQKAHMVDIVTGVCTVLLSTGRMPLRTHHWVL